MPNATVQTYGHQQLLSIANGALCAKPEDLTTQMYAAQRASHVNDDGDVQVQLEETREETQASFQDQMRALQAQVSRVGDELAVTQQQAQELQESSSQSQEELRVARISSDHLSNDLARALEQASTWREECVTLQVITSCGGICPE